MISTVWLGLVILLNLFLVLFLFRFILTWFPELDLNRFPINLVSWPTEIFLQPTRKIIPLFGGVDMSPFIWVAFMALLQELLVGQQGVLTLLKG